MTETEKLVEHLANVIGMDIKYEPKSSPLMTRTDRVLVRVIQQVKILKKKYQESEDLKDKFRKDVEILLQHVRKDEVLDGYGNPWPFETCKPGDGKTIGFRRATVADGDIQN
jgi:hypothetical protein